MGIMMMMMVDLNRIVFKSRRHLGSIVIIRRILITKTRR